METNIIKYSFHDKNVKITIDNNEFLSADHIDKINTICEEVLENHNNHELSKTENSKKEFYHCMSLYIHDKIYELTESKISYSAAREITKSYFPDENNPALYQILYKDNNIWKDIFKNIENDLKKILDDIKRSSDPAFNWYFIANSILCRVEAYDFNKKYMLTFNDFIDEVKETIYNNVVNEKNIFLSSETVDRIVEEYLPNFRKRDYLENIPNMRYIANNIDDILDNIKKDVINICKYLKFEYTYRTFVDKFIELVKGQLPK